MVVRLQKISKYFKPQYFRRNPLESLQPICVRIKNLSIHRLAANWPAILLVKRLIQFIRFISREIVFMEYVRHKECELFSK